MAENSGTVEMKQKCENQAKCMQMIQAVLDGSATKEEIEHFKSNIDVCMPCIEVYELEKGIKNILNTKIEKKCCPQQTIDLLKAKIGLAGILFISTIIEIKLFHIFILS
jgi:anti-sigma factor (TIGR02949 family)